MRSTLLLLAVLSALSCLFGQLAAQQRELVVPPIPLGSRIRVTAPNYRAGRITGELVRMTLDSVEVRRGSDRTEILPLASISRLERSSGRSRLDGAGTGLVTGMWTGGGAMAVSVLAGADLCLYVSCLRNDPAGALGAFLIGAILGAPVGAVVGALVGSERWDPVGWTVSVRRF